MHYIVALGNPGTRYDKTRHNIGWALADRLVERAQLPLPHASSRYRGRLCEGVYEGAALQLLYPDTYMNKSGEAAAALVPRDRIEQLIVLHDDIALPLGKVRVSVGSGAAGHNGVASVIDALSTTEFTRVRLGVGAPPPLLPLEQYVLQPFLPEEAEAVEALMTQGFSALELILTEGVEMAMNKVNGGN